MRHHLRSCDSAATIKILKTQLLSVLIPLLSNSDTDEISNKLTISIAALIAEAIIYFDVDISSNQEIDQTISNLLNPLNSLNAIETGLSLILDLLNGHYSINPEIIECFPPLLEVDIELAKDILGICIFFAKNGCSEIIKEAILLPLLEDPLLLPKDAFIQLINLSGASLLPPETMEDSENETEAEGDNDYIISDSLDNQIVSFIISCMNDPDESKSAPAMLCFSKLQNYLDFIPDSVILLYNNLAIDDGREAGEDQTVQGYISTLSSIAENHPEEMLEFIIPQIEKDLSESEITSNSPSMKSGLRGLVAIAKCLPESEIEKIYTNVTELLNTPMQKEAIFTLEKIALVQPDFYPQSLNSIFPFICFNESEDEEENSNIRMQAQRSLLELMKHFSDEQSLFFKSFFPCEPFINYVFQMLQIANELQYELNLSLEFTDYFIKSVESLLIEEGENENDLTSCVKTILDLATQTFLSADNDDLLFFISFGVISSSVQKMASSFLEIFEGKSIPADISFYPVDFMIETVTNIHPKCLELPDDLIGAEMTSMYMSLFSLLNCKNDEIANFRDSILEIIQSFLPKLCVFISTRTPNLSSISWQFSGSILLYNQSFFQESLLKDCVETVLGFDEEMDSDFLGNIAYVFCLIFKHELLSLDNLDEDDFEKMIQLFQKPIEKESSIKVADPLDLQNISLILLRLAALTNLKISRESFSNAVEILQTIQEEYPDIYEETQEMISIISQNNPMNEEEEEEADE